MNKYLLSLCLVSYLLLAGCAHSPSGNVLENRSDQSQLKAQVLLVNTNKQVERYRVAEQAFIDTLKNVELVRLDLSAEVEPVELLLDELNGNDYQGVYCIGAKALGSVDYIDPEIPRVFSSVLNWRQFYSSEGRREQNFGVASEMSLLAQLTWFKHVFPDIRRLGVLSSDTNTERVKEAQVHARALGIELLNTQLQSASHIAKLVQDQASKVDALWLISDPVVLSSEDSVEALFRSAAESKLPVFSNNPLFVDMGAVFSISADLPTTGRQAALMMQSILRGENPPESITYPAGSHLILNLKALSSSQLNYNDDALDSVSEIRD